MGSSISKRRERRIDQVGPGKRVAYGDVGGAVHPDDVAGVDVVHLLALEAARHPEVGAARVLGAGDLPVGVAALLAGPLGGSAHQLFSALVGAFEHPAAADAPQIVTPSQGGDLHAEGGVHLGLGRGDVLHYGLEEGVHALVRVLVGVADYPAFQGRAVDHGEVGLVVGGPQLEEEVEGLVEGAVRIGLGSVDLVDHHYGTESQAQSPHEHVAGLRHGALVGVDQQEHGVDHGEYALYFTGEVGVPGRVDDVDEVPVPLHRAVLGADGYAPLSLQVVVVHDPLFDALVVAEDVGLTEDRIDQGGLAVVDVGDDGHIADAAGLMCVSFYGRHETSGS